MKFTRVKQALKVQRFWGILVFFFFFIICICSVLVLLPYVPLFFPLNELFVFFNILLSKNKALRKQILLRWTKGNKENRKPAEDEEDYVLPEPHRELADKTDAQQQLEPLRDLQHVLPAEPTAASALRLRGN